MKIFLSWSGDVSGALAEFLKSWLPNVIQSLDPWTSRDIEKGARWSSEISDRLDESPFGVVCLTPENVDSPWLHFEAGAIVNSVRGALTEGRVTPLLMGLRQSDLKDPLSQFQATMPEREDVMRLMTTINSALPQPLGTLQLTAAFDKWWPEFQTIVPELTARLREFQPAAAAPPGHRPEIELLQEILEKVRDQERAFLRLEGTLSPPSPPRQEPPSLIQSIVPGVFGAAAGYGAPLESVGTGTQGIVLEFRARPSAKALARVTEWLAKRGVTALYDWPDEAQDSGHEGEAGG